MSSDCHLVRPTPAYGASYLAALREGFVVGREPARDEKAIATIASDLPAHLRSLDVHDRRTFEVNGRVMAGVPSNSFWLVEKGAFIGSVSIRARIDTELLANFGGHIGYGIRPSRRGRGYGKRQLALALDVARGIGIAILRISCGEDNAASRRVIEANGGIFLRRCEPGWYSDKPYLLFEIPLL